MYLHVEDRGLLKDMISTVSELSGMEESVIEKDYYVTLILKELAKSELGVVFKGGTALSKAYHIIERFSEDIDITFEMHLGEARRKKVKYNLLKPLEDELQLKIQNWQYIESDKDLNHYDFVYDAVSVAGEEYLRPYVKVETALMSYAFPTERRMITSIIYDYLKDTDIDILEQYQLLPFEMKTQVVERTFIDKIFAVCDYYMLGRPVRNSRHLYDLYKLRPHVKLDESFLLLVEEVREQRLQMGDKIAPSASGSVDILQIANEIFVSGFYQEDYEKTTLKLIKGDDVLYDKVADSYMSIIEFVFGEA